MRKIQSLSAADLMALLDFINIMRESSSDEEEEADMSTNVQYLQRAENKIFARLSEMIIDIANDDSQNG